MRVSSVSSFGTGLLADLNGCMMHLPSTFANNRPKAESGFDDLQSEVYGRKNRHRCGSCLNGLLTEVVFLQTGMRL